METELVKISSGDLGIAKTIQKIIQLVNSSCMDLQLIDLARNIISSVPIRDKTAQADALFWYVKEKIRFVNDPTVIEMLQSPKKTLIDGWGDCDDFVIVLATLNQAIGNNVGYMTISYPDEKDFIHIFLVLLDGEDAPRFYDPSLPESYPGWYIQDFGRARLWFSECEYKDLGSWFSKTWKKIGESVKDVFTSLPFGEKIYKEIQRVEKKVRKERNRLFIRIAKEFARWEKDIGPFGKFLAGYVKFMGTVFSAGIMYGLGSRVEKNPFELSSSEWRCFLSMGLSIGSAILTFGASFTATTLLTISAMNVASTGLSVWDFQEKKKEMREAMKKLKAEKARLTAEARFQRESIAKLESEVLLLEHLELLQKESEERIAIAQNEAQSQIDEIWEPVKDEIETLKNGLDTDIEKERASLYQEITTKLENEISPYLWKIPSSKQLEISSLITGFSS